MEGSGRERISKQMGEKARGMDRAPLRPPRVRRQRARAPGPQRAKSIDFIDFDVSGRAPPGPEGLKA